MGSPIEHQHSAHRILTPPRFAKALVEAVRRETGSVRVAALYVAFHGPYPYLADVECWPIWAERYPGPWPIVAHPPCGPWGRCKPLCKYQDPQCGIDAIELVHRHGGVIEQPIGSKLFALHGRREARLSVVDQWDWGHRCRKKTWLYWFFPVRVGAEMSIDW